MIPTFLIRPLLYLVAVAAIAGALYYIHHSIDSAGYRRGKAEVTDQYRERDAKATKAANDRIRELETSERTKETAHAKQLVDIADKFSKEKENDIADKDRVIAGLRDGTIKLRVRIASSASASCGSQTSTVDAATGRVDAAGATGLLAEPDAAFLVERFSRADTIAHKVNRLQELVKKQIEACNQ